jgi:hypothetical protein
MTIDHQVTCLITMGQTCWGAIVTRGKDALVTHKHGANMGAVTRAALGHTEGDIEKIFVPTWTLATDRKILRHDAFPSGEAIKRMVLWMKVEKL